jgi:hypothetical protein
MKAMKKINAINFTALANLTLENKHSGIIVLLAIESSSDGMVILTSKSIVEATGMDRKTVRVAMHYLKKSHAIIEDVAVKDVYYINSQLFRIHDSQAYSDAQYTPEFSRPIEGLKCVPKPTRAAIREIERMNKLSDAEIVECL